MSRFDRADPGTDPTYCDALAPEPEDTQDYAETDAHDVLSALASFRSQTEASQDLERVMRLWALARLIATEADATMLACGAHADRLVERCR